MNFDLDLGVFLNDVLNLSYSKLEFRFLFSYQTTTLRGVEWVHGSLLFPLVLGKM